MRLRNKPWAEDYLNESLWVINNPEENKGKWNEVFDNSNQLHLEIGMGKGKFIEELFLKNNKINYIGLEKYKSVQVIPVSRFERKYNINEVKNIKLISENAENLTEIFAKNEIDKIYINFPDPWPKERHSKRRLVHRDFLKRYFTILKDGGLIEFKSDQENLYNFFLEEIKEYKKFKLLSNSTDLHKEDNSNEIITTEYEEKFINKGNKIFQIILKK